MKELSVQSLKSIFDYFEQQTKTVLWVRDAAYQRQLYVGSYFEEIWGRPAQLLYDSPEAFSNFVIELDRQQVQSQQIQRTEDPYKADGLLLYRIADTEGNIRFLKDLAFVLVDEKGKQAGFAGICQMISAEEWEALKKSQADIFSGDVAKSEAAKKELFAILQKELSVKPGLSLESPSPSLPDKKIFLHKGAQSSGSRPDAENTKITLLNDGSPIILTNREAQCLYHLAIGRTAKQTAAALKVSPRTVVFHLDNVRNKAHCHNKIELLSKLRVE